MIGWGQGGGGVGRVGVRGVEVGGLGWAEGWGRGVGGLGSGELGSGGGVGGLWLGGCQRIRHMEDSPQKIHHKEDSPHSR